MVTNFWPTLHPPINTSSTENLVRRPELARRHGFWSFLARSPLVPFALFAGISCIFTVVFFASWLSKQILHCPAWASNCTVPRRTQEITDNIGTVQGISTVVYSIGLAAIAYAAHAFSESALWPLLYRQNFTLNQMDIYLKASGGSIASSPAAVFTIRNLNSGLILFATINITLLPLAGAPLMGRVFNQQNQSSVFESLYERPGGMIGPIFIQRNPPGVMLERAAAWYTSWAWNMSTEPMGYQRSWILDRKTLSECGNFSANAVRLQQETSCTGWKARPKKWKNGILTFNTRMNNPENGRSEGDQHSTAVKVRNKDKLAVWADDYVFESPTKTRATVVFAAINGSIVGGDTTTTEGFGKQITSIACQITIEFVDDILTVGVAPDTARAQLGSVAQLRNSKSLNELALWFAISPVGNGASVFGTMPMYDAPWGEIPLRFTSTNEGLNKGWEMEKIRHFISVSIGATALRASTSPDANPVTMRSSAHTLKLDPNRPLLLLVLPVLILINAAFLVLWNARLYRQTKIPCYQQAKLSEILTFSQSNDLREAAESAWRSEGEKNELDSLGVRYWYDEGAWALHTVNARSKGQKKSRRQSLAGYELVDRNV